MQRNGSLDAAAGEFGDVLDLDAGFAKDLGGAAGGDEFDRELGLQGAGKFNDAVFVGDGDQGAFDGNEVGGGGLRGDLHGVPFPG